MEYFHVEDAGLRRELWNSLSQQRHGISPAVTQKISRAARPKITIAERRLLELLTYDRELRDTVIPIIEPSDYEHLATADMFAAFVAIQAKNQDIGPEELMEQLDDDEEMLHVAHQILQSARPRGNEPVDRVLHEAENCVFALRGMAIGHRVAEISREAALATQSGNIKLANQLAVEQLELEKIRRSLQQRIE
jgi:hypothetical protein